MGDVSASHLICAVPGKALLLPKTVWTTSLNSPCGCFPPLFQDKAAHFSWEREPLVKGKGNITLSPTLAPCPLMLCLSCQAVPLPIAWGKRALLKPGRWD